MDDAALIGSFAETRSGDAFRELVQLHGPLVHAAALRQLNGNGHLAQDVTQEVFILLARKARGLRRHPSLAGWLYSATRLKALEALRRERRRRDREQEAHAMQMTDPHDEAPWERLRPLLDQSMHELSARDREALLLRYFQGQPYAAIAASLGMTEQAAQKRGARALERLRAAFARHGVGSTSAGLAAALSTQAAPALPAGVASAAGAALAASGAASTGLWTLVSAPFLPLMATSNKMLVGGVLLTLILNVTLVGLISPRIFKAGAGVEPNQGVVNLRQVPGTTGASIAADDASNLALGRDRWNAIMALGLEERLARLRTMGLPREVVRRVAIADVQGRYFARYLELMGAAEELPPFWTAEKAPSRYFGDPERSRAVNQFFTEYVEALRAVIGSDAIYGFWKEDREAIVAQFGDLPPEKAFELHWATRDLMQERMNIVQEAAGAPTLGQQQQLADIDRRFRQRQGEFLTADEQLRLDLHGAAGLRTMLSGFNPTEEEFRMIFLLRREYTEKLGAHYTNSTPEQRAQWSAAETEIQSKIEAALGPERRAQYTFATNQALGAPMVARVVARLGLPVETGQKLLAAQQEVAQSRLEAGRMRLGADALNARIEVLSANFENRATELLGGRAGLEAYRQHAGQWMTNTFGRVGGRGRGAP